MSTARRIHRPFVAEKNEKKRKKDVGARAGWVALVSGGHHRLVGQLGDIKGQVLTESTVLDLNRRERRAREHDGRV
jgi:hypothetical protein